MAERKYRSSAAPVRAALCRMLDMNFGEFQIPRTLCG
jgi:hypothetical protein